MGRIDLRIVTAILATSLARAGGPWTVARNDASLTDHGSRFTGHDPFSSQALATAGAAAQYGPRTFLDDGQDRLLIEQAKTLAHDPETPKSEIGRAHV